MSPLAEKFFEHKCRTVEELGVLIGEFKKRGKRIVHCHGVFDLLHIGHIRHFQEAKRLGDILIVTITPDQFVDKGPDRPAFSEILRIEAIASLSCVDFVAVNEYPTAVETLRIFRPDYYVKGAEFKNASSDRVGKIEKEKQVVKEIGAEFSFTDDLVFSSSNLINRYLSTFSDEINSYLSLLRSRYTLDSILHVIDSFKELRVLVVGDAILDEYQYCTAIGKSSKDPTMVVQYQSQDVFAGGAFAVANHVAGFTDDVDLLTVLGDTENKEQFILSQLNAKINPEFFYLKDAPTTLKRRIVDGYSFTKLFEIYEMDDSGLSRDADAQMCEKLEQTIQSYDVVIAADFGHGAISENLRKIIVENRGFTAVNTQANAGNRGFHTISKYAHFDYACIALHEFFLEIRNRQGMNLRKEMHRLLERLEGKSLMVTLGRDGSAACKIKGEYVKVPSLSDKIVDRVGAGDAFFALTSLAASLDTPLEIIAFLGNVVGAMAVQTIGNKKAIDRMSTEKYITALMK